MITQNRVDWDDKYLEEKMVEGAGFEPAKVEPSDLQSDPFGHSGTPPNY